MKNTELRAASLVKTYEEAAAAQVAIFVQGFEHGQRTGEATRRKAIEILDDGASHIDVDTFCMGTVDGASGDFYRLDLLTETDNVGSDNGDLDADYDNPPTAADGLRGLFFGAQAPKCRVCHEEPAYDDGVCRWESCEAVASAELERLQAAVERDREGLSSF